VYHLTCPTSCRVSVNLLRCDEELTGDKVTNKYTVIMYLSLKYIYLFISYRAHMFRLFPSHHQGACYMVQRKNNVFVFKIRLFTLVLLSLNLLCVCYFNTRFQFTVCLVTHSVRRIKPLKKFSSADVLCLTVKGSCMENVGSLRDLSPVFASVTEGNKNK
jgi:hypothetical protein